MWVWRVLAGVVKASLLSCCPGDRAGQHRGPFGARLGRPGCDMMEKKEEFSAYFYIVLCTCPYCFALNSVGGVFMWVWGVISGILAVKQVRECTVYCMENSFSSWAKWRLLSSIVKKSSARAARQNVLLLWLQELEAGERWHELAFQMFWGFFFSKRLFWRERSGGSRWGCFSLTDLKQC